MPSPTESPRPEPAGSSDPDLDVVVLVDAEGRPQGVAPKWDAHRPPGLLHAAISVVIVGPDDRVLIQQRAAAKPLFGAWWANSCCTHPAPGEDLIDAAHRRVRQELGMALDAVEHAGSFVYRAVDEVTGLVEYEYDTVLVAGSSDVPRLDPAEVRDWAWFDVFDAEAGRRFTPWAVQVHAIAASFLVTRGVRPAR